MKKNTAIIPELPDFSEELKKYWETEIGPHELSETEQNVLKKGKLIIKVAAGSQSFGLATATSDVDIHGVYILNWEERIRHDAPDQIADPMNNEVYWDITKFLAELNNANPQALEMLYAPRHCVFMGWELLEEIRNTFDFLNKRCNKSFAEYARGQVDKATGMNKKVFDPQPKERPRFVDFVYVLERNRALPLMKWIKENYRGKPEAVQRWFALAKIDHADSTYAMYYQRKPLLTMAKVFAVEFIRTLCPWVRSVPEHKWRWAYGAVRDINKSNDIQLNSIPKGIDPVAHVFVNRNDFARRCKKWYQYWDWVKRRNEERYNTTLSHGQGYDAKNIMHCVRLLQTAYGIATEHTVPVYRADKAICKVVAPEFNKHPYDNDRDFLLAIKRGEWTFDDIIAYINAVSKAVDDVFNNTVMREKGYSPVEMDLYAMDIAKRVLNGDNK